ncbi:unnamed protein product [Tilletia laevis]|uniref:Uncharacterized protein n=2 Tax=Tilletia TaxID=13289 RepID=A0A9N8QGT1_9BASI|nr:hypothetical protein CF336_g7471 [Tilletia laevis]KAE8247389.1 hypothetical protein A4X03_0g7057 [Tilletia caries]CAD6986363.1 unnamed protein product [Tilletia controversa]CAD6884354.1 unnamed protein product [Tilletia caries]CAD6922900.1 unnamed protein product [Tilletia laevis]
MNANVAVEARPTRSASNKSNLPASSYSSKPQYCSRLFPVPTRYTFLLPPLSRPVARQRIPNARNFRTYCSVRNRISLPVLLQGSST